MNGRGRWHHGADVSAVSTLTPGAHRRADGDLLDVLALGARRLGLDQRVEQRVEIGAQVLRRERRLADARMDDAGLLDAIFDLAALGRLTAAATFIVTVPSLGLGIMPLGPSILPRRPTRPIMSGVAMQRSKSIVPPWTISSRSSAPTTSAPAAVASSALAPRANTPTRTVLPVPLGSVTTPRTIWSAWRGSTPRLTRDLDRLVELGGGVGLGERRSPRRCRTASRGRRRWRASSPSWSAWPWYQPSTTSRPIARAEPSIVLVAASMSVGVQVLHLHLGDLGELRALDLARDDLARLLRARLQAGGLLEQERRRRRLGDRTRSCDRHRR